MWGTGLLGREGGRACYASALPDLCGFEQLYLFLSLRGLVTAVAPAGCGAVKAVVLCRGIVTAMTGRISRVQEAACKVTSVQEARAGVPALRLPGRSLMSTTPGQHGPVLSTCPPSASTERLPGGAAWAPDTSGIRRDGAPALVEPTSQWPQGIGRGSRWGQSLTGIKGVTSEIAWSSRHPSHIRVGHCNQ